MFRRIAMRPSRDDRYPLPIFVFVAGLLGLVCAATLLAEPRMPALRAAVIVGLLFAHLLVHWYGPGAAHHERTWTQYALAQSGLGIALTLATDNPSVWVVVFTWLVGEAMGLLDKAQVTAITLVLHGVLGSAALVAVVGGAAALEWLGAILPTSVFVGLVVVLYKRQVEARERAQQLVGDLERANQQITAYAGRVEELTLINERQRMARELHDTLAQDVAGLVLQLEAASAHLDAGRGERAQAIVQQAMARARSTLRTARAAIDDLRAGDGRSRLSERLDALCRRFRAETGLRCDVTVDAGLWDTGLPPAQQGHLERIVAEALANIGKHARATHVTVLVRAQVETLTLRVADDGAGFDARQLPPTGHYGLRGLHERARLLGGTLDITSARGMGTSLLLDMPLVLSAAEHANA